jgi:hypothetical protein
MLSIVTRLADGRYTINICLGLSTNTSENPECLPNVLTVFMILFLTSSVKYKEEEEEEEEDDDDDDDDDDEEEEEEEECLLLLFKEAMDHMRYCIYTHI